MANADGVTPLHAAAAAGSEACLGALLGAGAPLEARLVFVGRHELSQQQESTSKTALYLAAEKGHAAAVGCLLQHGADPHAHALLSTAQAASRLSPLWAARRGGHADVEAMLVAAGATELAEAVPLPGEEPPGTELSS